MKSTTQNIKAIRLQLDNQGCGSAMLVQARHCVRLALDFIDWGCEELEHFEDCYVGEYDSEEEFPPIRSELLRGRTRNRKRLL